MNSVSPTSVQYLSQEELHHTDGRQFFNPRASSQGGSYPGLFPRSATCNQYNEPDEVDKIKSKLLSTWNNMKYGKSRYRNCVGMGRSYHCLIVTKVNLDLEKYRFLKNLCNSCKVFPSAGHLTYFSFFMPFEFSVKFLIYFVTLKSGDLCFLKFHTYKINSFVC